MAYKAVVVAGDSKHRDLGAVVEAKLNELSGTLGALSNVQVQPDLTTVYGKALVIVEYETKKSKEKER